jgi:hypothetical protein
MTIVNLKSALVSGAIMGILAVASYILNVGDIFALDFKSLANIAAVAVLTAVVSFIKSSLTTNNGNFLGAVRVK